MFLKVEFFFKKMMIQKERIGRKKPAATVVNKFSNNLIFWNK